jgi:hypothetical protein
MEFDGWVFFENLSRKFRFYWNMTGITGPLHEDQYTFMILSCSVLLRAGNVPYSSCREKTHISFWLTFLRKSCRLWEIVKKISDPLRPHMTIWHICIACWVPKATHTHTHARAEYLILTALLRQQWLRERALHLPLYVHCYCLF